MSLLTLGESMIKPSDALSRLGTESAFEVLARAQTLAQQGKDIINLGIGQPDFKTPDHIVEAGVKALRDGHHGYTPANGILELREAVSADIKKYRGVDVDPDLVMIVPGGKVTMFFAIKIFGEQGVEIIYPKNIWRARCRNNLPKPRFPDLRERHQLYGCNTHPNASS